MTRGFITIATGKELYYQLAQNLLKSYRLYSRNPMPFAILCDRENTYTEQFDQTVILEHPLNSFWDKFELLVKAPYDETIFIDADCLAYADLNEYWDYFAGADDFTGCGTNYPIESERGLFQAEEIGEYCGRAHWKPDICGGLYFIRRGEICNALYKECQHISQNYDSFHWPDYCAPRRMKLCFAWLWRYMAYMPWMQTRQITAFPGKRPRWSLIFLPGNAHMLHNGIRRWSRDG